MATRTTAASRGQQDAIAMLKDDHDRVKRLAEQFERTDDDERKRKIAERICQELEVHARLEEEIFYPATRAAIKDDDMMNEAQVEHDSAKDLIRQIKAMSPSDEMYDAKVKVLAEYVNHHVEEEEGEMFKKARRAKVDVVELGRQMAERRQALEAERSMEPFDTIAGMLMMPIRAAASAARAGVAASRRASSGTSNGTARRARAGTRSNGTRAATSTTRATTGATRSATRATSRTAGAATRAAGTATRAAGTTARKAAGTTARATASAGRGGRAAAGAAGGRASASSGRKSSTGTKRAQSAGGRKGGSRSSGGRKARGE